jgi:hypothetical protein
LVALPLIVTVARNKVIQTRVREVNAPLNALRQGDVGPVLANVPRILGMVTVRGDATVRNNLPNRPVFPGPIWGGLFYLGLVVALSRPRDARSLLLFAWLGAMVAPSVVTIEAPNFVRTLGAMPAVMILPAVGGDWLLRRLDTWHGALVRVGWVLIGASAVVNLGWTGWDYFVRWTEIPETQFVWQTDLRDVAAWLDARPDLKDVTVGGLSNASMDEPSLQLMLTRPDLRSRWCDPGSPLSAGGGLLIPNEGGWLVVPNVVPMDADLMDGMEARWAAGERLTAQRFTAYPLQRTGREGNGLNVAFAGGVSLAEVSMPDADRFVPGATASLISRWAAGAEVAPALKIFVHLVDGEGAVRAQHDGLDCPSRFWRMGDRILQRHDLQLPDDLPPGRYAVRIGVYDPRTLAPYPSCDGASYYELATVDVR